MADLTDLTQNVSIHDEVDDVAITSTTDGAKRRLDVQALIAGGTFSLQPYIPVLTYDSAGTALTTSWTTIVNYTGGEGRLDFISVATGGSTYKVRLTIDGTEVFDVSMSDLNALGLTNAVNVNIWAETALKNFRYRPLSPNDFTTSLKVELATTLGTTTAYWLVNYRTQG